MKIGFIGFGNMARAIAKGLIDNEVLKEDDLFFSTRSEESRLAIEKEWHINGMASNQAVVDQSDVILLAVKPHQVDQVLSELTFPAGLLLLSVVAGYSSDQLNQYIPADQCIRTMPNLNAQVNASMTALVENKQVTEEDMAKAKIIFNAVGEVMVVPEDQLGIFIALAGSSPALVFLFIDTLARAAVKYGMPKDKATEIAAQAVLGSGKTVKEASDSPWNLIDHVSSPGGITVEAVLSLLESDFSSSLITAVDKMIEKNEEMTKKNAE
ncbi:pyrroline-5-carboxylate reductase [Alkalibacterium putridalgicola]|jgi:pyrroline-5-carboxylate reductase|uniref:Pyrroline-5-carboxylate reductase n=1 Tax=Alkalibacterium putridalgicola TaxID=426703 RepID=A0A1H7R6R2_9LACT|nr:pyrroline-5-carboxylate reductase [Alkalibacterium putridalgicola]GEK90050.1 pyrroline-5-carboxylate reductase [Alkalibacterium putridalgicola]SEL55227.1 pyrroline-5-carboxylate reductase [Alkalibacterium putridalgicola]